MALKVLFIWLKIHLITVKEKHIYVKYDFVRHIIDEGGVLLEKVHTQKNCADMFMKPVTLEKLQWCIASIGLQKR